jgi:DNA-binding transcriptional MerR regulator/methylmalonyl-CoA mutase cobalamin-binding subunit
MRYLIKTVSKMVGIPKNTLIAWERRHGVVEPDRTESGYRRYSDEDVRTLVRIKELISAGYRISEAAEIVQSHPAPSLPDPEEHGNAGMDRLRESLKQCLLAFDRGGADRLITRLVDLSFIERLDQIFLPLAHEIGLGWEEGTVSVAQEHFASGWAREQLFVMMSALRNTRANAMIAVCATPSGDRHEFGILAVSIRLALRGWQVVYLGVDAPSEEVAGAILEVKPNLVAASIVLERDADIVTNWVQVIREAVGPDLPILIGGRAADRLNPALLTGRTAIAYSLDDIDGRSLQAWVRNE